MTSDTTPGKVSLSGGNWAGIILTIFGGLGGQWMLIQGRVTTLEANYVHHEKRIDAMGERIDQTRREFVEELRLLRQEIQQR